MDAAIMMKLIKALEQISNSLNNIAKSIDRLCGDGLARGNINTLSQAINSVGINISNAIKLVKSSNEQQKLDKDKE